MTALAPTEPLDALVPAALRLHARLGGAVDLVTVRLVLDECYEDLRARATVTTFLVVLAERTAAARLAAHQAGTRAGSTTKTVTGAPSAR